jgi:probable F420-dependent oxidoreductase
MKLGLYLRNMGPASERETVLACARGAEAEGIDDLWVADHVAIPPDDAVGSDGRYLDPLATLAWLAAATARISLGTGVLVLPYRPPLATAKWIATIQELSGGRFLFGAGVGWMKPEFAAVGVPFRERGRISDATLAFLDRCFSGDEVEANGQRFLFRPRPDRPPLFVGGAPPHAFRRAARFGGGWMPMGGDAATLAQPIRELREAAAAAGRPPPEVALVTRLDLDDRDRGVAQVEALAGVGVTRVVHGFRYSEAAPFLDAAAKLARLGARVRA